MKHLIKPCFVKMAEAVVKKHKGAVAVVYKLGEGKSHRKVGGVTRTVRKVVGAMQVVVLKSPKCLRGLLRRLFGIKKETQD